MRVLDLGCGRAISSIFLHREFGVQVWATDLWYSVSENILRVRDAGVDDGVFPIRTVLVDDRGYRWIEPWRLPWDPARDWTVIDGDGRWLGSVAMPGNFRPADFRDNRVLGLLSAFDQSSRPAIYRLRRQGTLSVRCAGLS